MPSVWPVSMHLKKSLSVLKLELLTQNTPYKASSLVFQMAYRRDVGYYHQVSAFLYFLSSPVCVFILGAQLCQQWDLNGVLGRHHLWYIFSKSHCADENEGHNSTLEKQTLNNEISPDEKAGIAYSPRSGFQMAYLKDEALWRMIFMEIVFFSPSRMSVCVCRHLFVLCREDWKLFPLLSHQGCHNVLIKVTFPPPRLFFCLFCSVEALVAVVRQRRYMKIHCVTFTTSQGFIYGIL